MARQPFNTRWAQGVESEDNLNTFKDPGDVRISTGWEGGQDKDAPPAGHENFWHNRVDSALQGVERQGVMVWHPQAIYGLGAPTYGPDGNYYESTAANNIGNHPSSSVGFWRSRGPSFFSGHVPGDLKMVAHNNIPTTGWLKCNGAILLRSSYQLLFSAIGTVHNIGGETNLQFRLPDFRGEFVRGFDDGRGVDPGREFGSYQADALQEMQGSLNNVQFSAGGGLSSGVFTTSPKSVYGQFADSAVISQRIYDVTFKASQTARTSPETRPRNKTVNYWIRY